MEKDEQEFLLLAMLPEAHNYKFLQYHLEQNNLQDNKFSLEARVDVCTNVKLFLSELNHSRGCTFNMQSGRPDRQCDSHRVKYSGYRKCCMKVIKSGDRELQSGRNTNCGAKINFRLENPVAQNAEQRQEKENFPLWIKIEFEHNHSINRAEFLKYRSVGDKTKSEFLEMFQQGFSPSTALAEMRRQIKVEFLVLLLAQAVDRHDNW